MNAMTGENAVADLRNDLAELWCAQTRRHVVSDGDDFFATGGDSMSAIRMLVATMRNFDIDFDVDVFFAEPTFASLLALVAESLRKRQP